MKEGKGEYRWSNGNRYNGEYYKDKPHGSGLYSTIHGHNYVGDFANGRFQGFGKFTFGTGNQTGDSYEGDFFKGEFHGNGTYFYANGDRFVGGFRFGKKTGRGILYTHDGETIPGRWRNDKLVAEVKFVYSEKATKFGNRTNLRWRFPKNLWPS